MNDDQTKTIETLRAQLEMANDRIQALQDQRNEANDRAVAIYSQYAALQREHAKRPAPPTPAPKPVEDAVVETTPMAPAAKTNGAATQIQAAP